MKAVLIGATVSAASWAWYALDTDHLLALGVAVFCSVLTVLFLMRGVRT